jgi:hypothetical protein
MIYLQRGGGGTWPKIYAWIHKTFKEGGYDP